MPMRNPMGAGFGVAGVSDGGQGERGEWMAVLW